MPTRVTPGVAEAAYGVIALHLYYGGPLLEE